jgi:hypothetical protein
MKIQFRVVIPTIYSVFGLFFAGNCLWHIGHGWGCAYLYDLGRPGVLLFPKDLSFGIVWAFLAGLAQYWLVGYLLDRVLLAKRKKRSEL